MDHAEKPTKGNPAPDAEEARQQKIARIKKAVEDGTYEVSSDDVARKLIEHMLKPKA